MPAKELSDLDIPNGIEFSTIEINVRKKIWIMVGIYRPSSQDESGISINLERPWMRTP